MAKTLTKLRLITLLSLLTFLLSALHFQYATAAFEDDDDVEEYVLDSVVGDSKNVRRSRFLTTSSSQPNIIKKGTACDAQANPYVCNGVWADNGASLLYCCKTHCRNVLGDRNNCGQCGHKCGLGESCCGGVCTDVWWNGDNCGICNNKCGYGVKCDYGYCGYA